MVTPQTPRKCSGIWGQPAAVSLQKPLPSCTSPSLLPSSLRSLWKFPKPTSNGQVNSSASLSKVATKVLFSSLDQWSSPVGNVPPFIKVMTCLFCLNYTFLTGSRSLTPRRNVCVEGGGARAMSLHVREFVALLGPPRQVFLEEHRRVLAGRAPQMCAMNPM